MTNDLMSHKSEITYNSKSYRVITMISKKNIRNFLKNYRLKGKKLLTMKTGLLQERKNSKRPKKRTRFKRTRFKCTRFILRGSSKTQFCRDFVF